MHTEILLIRHGETEWNASGRFQGSKDISLAEEGVVQAKFLKERLQNDFDIVYASPLSRAMETAEIICEGTNLNPIPEDGIKEIGFGSWEGLTIDQIRDQYPEEFNIWRTDEENAALMGGDLSLKQASFRAKEAILKIASANRGKKIIIVAHGGIIKAGLIGLFDWKMTMYHKFNLGNTAITKLIITDSLDARLITLNDTSHLPVDYKLKSSV